MAALRADTRFPNVRELPVVQLRDHVTPFVGLLASQLMVVGETRGQAPELLGDGAQLHRVMAELHGAQRYRIGWGEADLEREVSLMLAEIERTLAHVVDAPGGAPDFAVAPEAVDAAIRYAAVARRVLERATQTALRAYRFAKTADAA